jgi:hypothetical protein
MAAASEILLVGVVAAVGVLHTIVPDHWVPITLIARQRGWSTAETARAALQAGAGHVVSTLLIASVVWLAGVAVATRFGHIVDTAASVALIAFGLWIAVSAWRELRGHRGHGRSHGHWHGHGDAHLVALEHGGHLRRHETRFTEHQHDHGTHGHDHDAEDDPLYAPLRADTAVLTQHLHSHRHGRGIPHVHWHDHLAETSHSVSDDTEASPPPHEHGHGTSGRTALLLILGSSPMVEGIPAFFAASQYGVGLIVVMSVVFALSTIATYVILCVCSTIGLQRVRLGPLGRYGEVMSGAFIALAGVAFLV